MSYEVSGFADANEQFHARGLTDGLPIIPPTPDRVAAFLEAAGLEAGAQIGFYHERRMPVLAEKLAINAVMAGCLPEYFPVVVAIVDAMLDPAFPIHVANSSTGSFTLGFIVNGPVRRQLGMNCDGNVLGPGNRANSTIGRAIRLIQMNVLGSVAGAGAPDAGHGRAVLDRSMMGQPAKYAGYHIVENEELFPSLLPVHVEMGYAPEDSTVTLMMIAGYHWICAHGEQTPEAWTDTMAHYIVHTGMLHESGYGVLLLPPENAHLFASAGWTKADIREALFAKTRRSVAWVKQQGWKLSWQRERFEPVQPGDEDRMMAMAGSSSPEDLIIAVCGGPAGSWPYYLYGGGGAARPIVRRIAVTRPGDAMSRIDAALSGARSQLRADGYDLTVRPDGSGGLRTTISAGPDACPDCLVPKSMMAAQFANALQAAGIAPIPSVQLIYPGEGKPDK
ncbi:MAG: hypothetical protein KDE55_11020 [Novosphingobium sp.]|nr:hypothetical protein [Novosphingobium sp.]